MKRTIRTLCLGLVLMLSIGSAACSEPTAAQPASEPVKEAAVTAAPTQAPTAEPTAEPTPEPTPLPTEYAFEGETTWEEVASFQAADPALRKLDLRNCTLDVRAHAAQLAALDLEELKFSATLCGAEITDETEVFTPATVPEEWDMEVLKLLPKLRSVDLTALPCEPEQIQMVQAFCPEQEVLWKLDLCGVEVGPDTDKLNYNDQPIDSLEPFYRTLPLLTELTSLEMCGCGVGNEDMDALRTAFPQAGIVWSITSKYWTIRTDTDHFATWRVVRTDENGKILEAYSIAYDRPGCVNEDVDWLQYCHDIIALDVGHNKLTNIEFVRNMHKLKYLITSGNDITDISPVADCHELVYFELFADPVKDLSPLSGLTKLLDINICSCPVSDLSPLYGLKQLERLWLTPYAFTYAREAEQQFREQVPGCNFHYVISHDMTGDGWRKHPRYTEYRLALGRAKP